MKCCKCGADLTHETEDGTTMAYIAIRVQESVVKFKRHKLDDYCFCADCLLNALGIPDDVEEGGE